MTAILFLMLAAAMYVAWKGRRKSALTVFAVAAVLALLWFHHHLSDALALDF
jgi:hypothetical protein